MQAILDHLAHLPDVLLFVTLYHSNASSMSSRSCSNRACVTMRNMSLQNSAEVISILRERLEPAERADSLADAIKVQYPPARKAAVLLGLFDYAGETHLAFIRRAATLRSHSGEIAFPGGAVDPGDDSVVTTALREAREEIGLDPARVEVLGVLPPGFTAVSNFVIMPVVAFLPRGLGTLQLQEAEVTEFIFMNMAPILSGELRPVCSMRSCKCWALYEMYQIVMVS